MDRSYLCFAARRRISVAIAVVIVAACCAFSMSACRVACADDGLAEYNGKIEHIFTHELVFDTAKAFAPTNKLRDCFDKDHLTAKEFGGLLDELYNNGYVLISLDRATDGATLRLPVGKKPLVMSFDDMTYDTVDRGCIDKIVYIDGKLCDFTEHAQDQVTRERENITLLESFIERHPDFSFDGGRATVCVNGYNGILGYRVTPDCRVSDARMKEDTEQCKELAAVMKRLGYTFASHTYYHSYFDGTSAVRLEKDCAKWKKYIEPIVGDTRVLCYPAGRHNAKSAKNGIFKRYGFDVFLCVGNSGTEYERSRKDEKYVYRKPFDGTALRLYGEQYAQFADTRAIYDNTRFRPFSYKGGYH